LVRLDDAAHDRESQARAAVRAGAAIVGAAPGHVEHARQVGPLARRVLATLTRSPLSVVLRRGPAGPVPAHWIWHRFGSVEF
jgi:hypothetical protein